MKTILYYYSGSYAGNIPTWGELQMGFLAYLGEFNSEKGVKVEIGNFPVKVIFHGKNLEDVKIFRIVSTMPLHPSNFSLLPEVDPLAHMRV